MHSLIHLASCVGKRHVVLTIGFLLDGFIEEDALAVLTRVRQDTVF